MSDLSLIYRLKLGEEEAYKILYEKHYRILCLYASKFVADSSVAESIVSEVIFNLWDKRANWEITTSLRNYLIQSVKNRCYNYLKQKQRVAQIIRNDDLSDISNEITINEDDSSDPLMNILLNELDLKIEESLAKLSDKTREIFLLSRQSGLKYNEIAESTGMSVDAVKYHIKVALSSLRNDLSDYLVLVMILYLSIFFYK